MKILTLLGAAVLLCLPTMSVAGSDEPTNDPLGDDS